MNKHSLALSIVAIVAAHSASAQDYKPLTAQPNTQTDAGIHQGILRHRILEIFDVDQSGLLGPAEQARLVAWLNSGTINGRHSILVGGASYLPAPNTAGHASSSSSAIEQCVDDWQFTMTEFGLGLAFTDEKDTDKERYKAYVNLDVNPGLKQFKKWGCLKVIARLQGGVDRDFVAGGRTETERIEIFPLQLAVPVRWARFGDTPPKFLFSLGQSVARTKSSDPTNPETNNSETVYSVELDFPLLGDDLRVIFGQTWRFDEPLEGRTSAQSDVGVKYRLR